MKMAPVEETETKSPNVKRERQRCHQNMKMGLPARWKKAKEGLMTGSQEKGKEDRARVRARLGERARDGAQLVAGFLGGLLLRPKLQDKQTSLPHVKSGYPATSCFTRDPEQERPSTRPGRAASQVTTAFWVLGMRAPLVFKAKHLGGLSLRGRS